VKEQNELGRRIARLIAAQGPISIAQFITLALHDPRGGYYATRDPLGADFITAPEMTQAFGELLGLWCAQVWHEQGKPNPARLVELGPGRATLMADALRAARLIPQFLAALEVVLVETSPVLAAIQKETLRDCAATLRWVTSAADIARDRPQFTIANEFLDALPIRQFAMREKFWCERLVGLDDTDELAFVFAPAPWRLSLPPERGEPAPGAVYETCAAANALVEDLARGIAAEGGRGGERESGFIEDVGLERARGEVAPIVLVPFDSTVPNEGHVASSALGHPSFPIVNCFT